MFYGPVWPLWNWGIVASRNGVPSQERVEKIDVGVTRVGQGKEIYGRYTTTRILDIEGGPGGDLWSKSRTEL